MQDERAISGEIPTWPQASMDQFYIEHFVCRDVKSVPTLCIMVSHEKYPVWTSFTWHTMYDTPQAQILLFYFVKRT